MKNTLVSLLVLLAGIVPGAAQAQDEVPEAGKDYIEIPNGSPLDPAEGMVVVEEFFNYVCPACYGFEPKFVAWTRQLPSYAKVVHIPAAFRPDFVQYAHAYYAAEIFGIVDKSHQAVYDAIHRSHVLPAEGDKPDEGKIAQFYSDFGVNAQKFLAAMKSFEVDYKVRRASDHMQRSKVTGTPAIVINGRYLVRRSADSDMFRTATYLIEKEHADQARADH